MNLNVGDAWRSHRDAARWKDLEGGFRVQELVGHSRMKLRLVAGNYVTWLKEPELGGKKFENEF